MKEKHHRLMVPLVLIIFLFSSAAVYLYVVYTESTDVSISHESGIYHESIELSVESLRPATILYTTDGSIPSLDNEDAMVYKSPIYLELEEETTTYAFQFLCIYEDGTATDVIVRDYILEEIPERFSTTYVVSVTGDEESLFGYEEGLFVRGRQFDEFMDANPEVDTLGTIIPANYFSDKEVPVHVAIYTQDGTSIISQNCGLKIYGNITRAKNQKSFRLIARYDYDAVNEFSYTFFPNLVSDKTNMIVDDHQRLSFHNSGNDNGYGFVRSELIGELARRAGFPDVLVAESVTVYINGKYQGVYWLQNTFDDRYFKEKYGEYEGEMVVCEGTLDWMAEENAEDIYEQSYSVHYNDFSLWVREADLQDEANWKRVCDTIDVDNFAQYMAIEYYIHNIDWPHNNVKVYRYVNDNGGYQEGTVFDGKYRYLLFDTDYGMGLKFQGWFGGDETSTRLGELSENNANCLIFGALLEREEFRDSFINAVLCLMNDSFSLDEVSEVLNDFNSKRINELQYMMDNTDLLKNSLWESDDNNMNNVYQEWQEILNFAEKRHLTIIPELDEKWSCGEPVDVTIKLPQKGNILIGNRNMGQEYTGYWLENFPMEISCELSPGVSVAGYIVNSEYVEGETISLTPWDWKQSGDKMIVEPVLAVEEETNLNIAEYNVAGTEDYVILENNGQMDILLSDYYITDSEDELYKGKLPSVILQPGQQYVIYGAKYSGVIAENSIRISFSWNENEKIFLVHEKDGIVEEATR